MLPPTDLLAIPDLVFHLEADLDPSDDLKFIQFITNDNLAIGSLINEAASKGNVAPVQAVSDDLMEPIPTIDFIILEDLNMEAVADKVK